MKPTKYSLGEYVDLWGMRMIVTEKTRDEEDVITYKLKHMPLGGVNKMNGHYHVLESTIKEYNEERLLPGNDETPYFLGDYVKYDSGYLDGMKPVYVTISEIRINEKGRSYSVTINHGKCQHCFGSGRQYTTRTDVTADQLSPCLG